jgi:hypothetical protein
VRLGFPLLLGAALLTSCAPTAAAPRQPNAAQEPVPAGCEDAPNVCTDGECALSFESHAFEVPLQALATAEGAPPVEVIGLFDIESEGGFVPAIRRAMLASDAVVRRLDVLGERAQGAQPAVGGAVLSAAPQPVHQGATITATVDLTPVEVQLDPEESQWRVDVRFEQVDRPPHADPAVVVEVERTLGARIWAAPGEYDVYVRSGEDWLHQRVALQDGVPLVLPRSPDAFLTFDVDTSSFQNELISGMLRSATDPLQADMVDGSNVEQVSMSAARGTWDVYATVFPNAFGELVRVARGVVIDDVEVVLGMIPLPPRQRLTVHADALDAASTEPAIAVCTHAHVCEEAPLSSAGAAFERYPGVHRIDLLQRISSSRVARFEGLTTVDLDTSSADVLLELAAVHIVPTLSGERPVGHTADVDFIRDDGRTFSFESVSIGGDATVLVPRGRYAVRARLTEPLYVWPLALDIDIQGETTLDADLTTTSVSLSPTLSIDGEVVDATSIRFQGLPESPLVRVEDPFAGDNFDRYGVLTAETDPGRPWIDVPPGFYRVWWTADVLSGIYQVPAVRCVEVRP